MEQLASFEYPATRIKKKAWNFALVSFNAEAGDLKCWSGVYRKDISQQGYQRILNAEHEAQIKKFLSDEKNVIPNSVVLAFNNQFDNGAGIKGDGATFSPMKSFHPTDGSGVTDDNTIVEIGVLKVHVHQKCLEADGVDDEVKLSPYRSAYAIDGQHRIGGGNAAGGAIYLPVTAFLGIDKEEQAFHFIVINRKARKVSKHDIDAVIPKSIYENLQGRLVTAGIVSNDADIVYGLDNLEDSPFKGMIEWANNSSDSAIIPKGAIDNTLKQVRKLPSDIKDLFDNEIALLIAIWRGVRRHLEPLWTSRQYKSAKDLTFDNQLIIKAAATLPAIQRAIVSVVDTGGAIVVDEGDSDRVGKFEESVYKYIKQLPLEFFYCTWNKTSITNESSIEALAKLIIKAVRTKKVPYADGDNWFKPAVSLEARAKAKEADKAAKAEQRKAEKAAAKAALAAKKAKQKPVAKLARAKRSA